jgi:regulator of sirC expression with transglutaminase-like and TPR domain
VRVLRNLKGIYWHQQDFGRALYVVNCILVLDPDNAEALRDRGRIYERLECFRAALADFRRYLDLDPGAADYREVRARLPVLLQAAGRLN